MEALAVEGAAPVEESAADAASEVAGDTALAPEATATPAPTGGGMTEEPVAESMEAMAPPTGEAYSVLGEEATPTPDQTARSAATEPVAKQPAEETGPAPTAVEDADAGIQPIGLGTWGWAAVLSGAGTIQRHPADSPP
jgi:hypothetical protein